MDWIDLALNRDKWRALLNTVKTFEFHKSLGNSSRSCPTGGFLRGAQLHEVS
jgi:hypothetical protein